MIKCKDLVVFLAIGFSSIFEIHSQELRINEFLAINTSGIVDEDSVTSDWIEIYNPSLNPVNLSGWALTDNIDMPKKWLFPDIVLEANAYLVVFASGKNRYTVGHELHTNFRLNGMGEYLALVRPDGSAASEFMPNYPEQGRNVSYGWYENTYIKFPEPTPGGLNTASSQIIVPPPVFNKKRGFYETAFNVVLTSPLGGTKMYYTLDGSLPTVDHAIPYSGPFQITTTSVVRAINVVEGIGPSYPATQTYLFLADVIRQPNEIPGYPASWGPFTAIPDTAPADYEMDPELVDSPGYAEALMESLKDIPTISLVTNKEHFFSKKVDEHTGGIYIYPGAPIGITTFDTGRGWERPVSFEYFSADGTVDVQVNCGVRIQGGHGRRPEKSPKNSFLLVFKGEYGPTKFKYPLFGDGANSSFNTLTIRAGFGNSWVHHSHSERVRAQYQRDIWGKDTQREIGHVSSHSNYVHLYINGIYWGLYAPSERMDDNFGAAYLGGEPEEYDVIKDYTEVQDGYIDAWNTMMEMANQGLETDEAYQKIQGNNPDGSPNPSLENYLDVVSLIDYMLINFYGGNTDWDHHNWAAMRNREKPGTGFKFFMWDGEHLVKTVSGNVLDKNNDGCPSRIFRQCLQNESFRHLFADRVQKHCYNMGVLTPESASKRWLERSSQVEKAVLAESARWGDYRRDVHPYQESGPFELYTKESHWLPQQEFMLNTFFPERTSRFIEQLRSEGLFPVLDAPVFEINNNAIKSHVVQSGDQLSMTADEGTIYYTIDGSDPAIWQSSEDEKEDWLVTEGALKKVLVPHSEVDINWKTLSSFDDAAWTLSEGKPGGIGYEKGSGYENLISLDVSKDMHSSGGNPSPSCFIRVKFDVSAETFANIGDVFDALLLNVNYDDGFVAYLNGEKVASANAPDNPLWNSVSTQGHEAVGPELFDISNHMGRLKKGENLLALHGLNQNLTSSDFLIAVSLKLGNEISSGIVSPTAMQYSGPVTLQNSVVVKARSFNKTEWSAANTLALYKPEDFYDLKITEIHYHPTDDGEIDDGKFEFIEIKNTGKSTLDLGGLAFVDGIGYKFPQGRVIAAGGFIVLAANPVYFYQRYAFMPHDEYRGQLNNDGERLVLVNTNGDTLCDVRYNDGPGWPQKANGGGFSLVPTQINPKGSQDNPLFWRASYRAGGSPGMDDLSVGMITQVNGDVKGAGLFQNYPNPFTGITYIDYVLPYDAHVKLTVFDMLGRKVTALSDQFRTAGQYQAFWEPKSNAGGIYYYRLEMRSARKTEVITRKMILLD
jgi:hypothetical protein